MSEDYGVVVKLIAITKPFLEDKEGNIKEISPTEFVEYTGRICYNSIDKLGSNSEWVKQRINQGHESILEHVSMSFYIECSRAVSHELVRHRLASYSQESQRYVKAIPDFTYMNPPEIKHSKMLAVMGIIRNAYKALLEEGVKSEIARYLLPNAMKTKIIVTMNLRELRHFIQLRTNKAALPEMQEVANKIKNICIDKAPTIFEGI